MITTPLITKLKSSGGTLYTFTSTSRDLTRVATNSSNYKFKFSHFACLNLPYIMQDTEEVNSTLMNYDVYLDLNELNYIQNLRSYISYEDFHVDFQLTDDVDTDELTKCEIVSLTPYEDTVTATYNNTKYTASLENRIVGNTVKFYIKLYFSDGTTFETKTLTYNRDYVGNNVEKGLYLEQLGNYTYGTSNDYNVAIAEHFQNYILNFEALLMNEDTYDTTLLRSPAERLFFNWLRKVGGIRFEKTSSDEDGYNLYSENVSSYGDNVDEYLGRTVQYLGNVDILNQVNVNGDSFGEIYIYLPSSTGASTDVYFRAINDTNYKNDVYTYGSEKIVGRSGFADEDKPIDDIRLDAIYDSDQGGNYYIGDEGYCLDFRESSYAKHGSIENMNSDSYINFEFNCVLIYYDLIKTGVDGDEEYATNLYGVLFLDNFVRDDTSVTDQYLAHINPLPKFRSSELDDGNAFALKLDLKIDTTPTSTMVRIPMNQVCDCDELVASTLSGVTLEDGTEVSTTTLSSSCECGTDGSTDSYVDPNDSRGFALYNSALEQLHKCIDIFYTQQNEIYTLQDRVETLESLIVNLTDMSDIRTELDIIQARLDSNGIIDTTTLTDMIAAISDKLNDYIESNNQIVESTQENNQSYKYVGRVSLDTDVEGDYIYVNENEVSLNLMNNTNLVLLSVLEPDDTEIPETEQLVITINTPNVSWKSGQSVKFVITDDFKFNNIKHDSLKIQTVLTNLGITIPIKTFDKTELERMKRKSEIEVICLDSDFSTLDGKFITTTR